MTTEPIIKYPKAARHCSTPYSISRDKRMIGYVFVTNATEPHGEMNLKTHQVISSLEEFNQTLTANANSNAFKVLFQSSYIGIAPKVMESLEDGGIFIDFIRDGNYYAFELHNDGDIIFIKKEGGKESHISELEPDDLTVTLFT